MADDAFVAAMVSLGSYRDNCICVTEITGAGHRFHGYRQCRFSQLSRILKLHQRNALFFNNSNGVLTIESRRMTSHNTCTGVVDPHVLTKPPYNLRMKQAVVNTGAVSSHVYCTSDAITDTLLHKLCTHPFVLDVILRVSSMTVLVLHDRNINNGLMQHIQRIGKTSCKLRTKSTACKSTKSRKSTQATKTTL